LLVRRNAPFDRYVAGDFDAITPAAKRGLALFIGKAACHGCHSGASFSDQLIHNAGVAHTGPNLPAQDRGAADDVPTLLTATFNGAGQYSDDPAFGKAKLDPLRAIAAAAPGAFRTKNLRTDVARTAPYMHNGSIATLAEVVAFYNRGGDAAGFEGTKDPKMKPLNLTALEQADVVAFLETLAGEPISAVLTADTSAR
jgi:cytochrome c peroxidase